MKRIKRFLFNFNIAYVYAFIAGIFVSLAANLFTTALVSESLSVPAYRIYGMTLFFFISSIGAFGVSALLEDARSKWESSGTPRDPVVIRDFIETKKRMSWMWFFFAIIFVGLIFSIFLLLIRGK